MYYPMKLRIVDTGYGLERLVWASKGSPTIYDAVFPEMVSRVMSAAGLSHMLDNKELHQDPCPECKIRRAHGYLRYQSLPAAQESGSGN